jgi:RNA polymerase sigma-70 factor (ECF subfamily)
LGEDLDVLLAGCAGGDAGAWSRLLEAVRQGAIDVALQDYHLNQEDAEDLAQLAQIRVLERLPQIRRPAAFPHWLGQIIHHLAIDLLRGRRPALSLDDPSASHLRRCAKQETTDHYHRALLRVDLERALSRLPAHYREPIRLHLLEGIPQEEVGRLLGRPRSTIATQIERGLARLRRNLSGLMMVSG